MGTRLRCAVPNLPKPMAPIGGRPFLEYQLDYWIAQGVSRFVLSVGYLKDVIIDHFGLSYREIPLTYAIEDEPLGTGGGLLLAAQYMSEPFLVLNGDTFFEADLKLLLRFHAMKSAQWTFSLFRTLEVDRYMGVCLKADGQIISFKSAISEQNRLANGGVYLVDPFLLEKTKFPLGQKLSLEDDLIPALMAQGNSFFGLEFNERFIDIGLPKDYFRAIDIIPN